MRSWLCLFVPCHLHIPFCSRFSRPRGLCSVEEDVRMYKHTRAKSAAGSWDFQKTGFGHLSAGPCTRGWGQRGRKAHATARLPRVVKHATTCRDSGSCRRFCFKPKHEQENRPPSPTLTLPTFPHSQSLYHAPRTHTRSQALSLLTHLSVCPFVGLFASLSCLLISSPPVAALEDPSYAPPPQPMPSSLLLRLFTLGVDTGPCALSLY